MRSPPFAAAASLLALLALAGCHAQPMIALENPHTGQSVECRSNPLFGDLDAQAEACARAYEHDGFVRQAAEPAQGAPR